MEDISSSEENVIPCFCENHCYKDINEGNINSYVISSIIYLKNKKKGTCRDNVFKYISDIYLVNICKKRYDTIIDKLLQEELICKCTYAKKETLSIVNNMQQLPELETSLENRNENLKEYMPVELKAFIESEFIDRTLNAQFERLVCNMEAEIVFFRNKIKNKNKVIKNLLRNFSKSQNLSYNAINKTFSISEKVLISHEIKKL